MRKVFDLILGNDCGADRGTHYSTLPAVQHADDLYYDSARRRVSGEEGHINVFKQVDANLTNFLPKYIPRQASVPPGIS